MTKNILLRVTQINAMFFDREIDKVLWQLVQECFKYLPPGYTASVEPELKLTIKLVTTILSVVRLNRTFGQKLLQVQYENLTDNKKVLYVIFQCLDYFKGRMVSNNEVNTVFTKIDMLVKLASVVNILLFLGSGKKPRLIERLLNIDQVYEHENIQRQFETKYMTRELLWNGLIEILVFLLPMINFQKVTRTIKTLNPFSKRFPDQSAPKKAVITLYSKCPHCGESPIVPHHMGCAHVFCYTCLKGNQLADTKYRCPICNYNSSSNICEMMEVQS